ncbi:Predicted arabinose efflux permease, MFS family [Asanoa hainanensis]|uniref:Predicted arabinose efflux permease, MFS family n=1 Tax=Asanoa hainanensis TaxID=560556 RepID=A0A239GHG3_9ACTN|nr:MFS transporter [Asanoa hainanensis]SNS68746.1 Predicted arabinose efflux permease, MFS family [Asanoa hainanensis]
MQPVTAATRRLLVAATGSRLADEAAAVAVALHVVARTGDAGLAGLVVAAFALPTLVTGPVLGALLDRLCAPRALFLANQVALATGLAGILVLAGRAPAVVLIGLGLLAGLTAPVLTGGYSALVPRTGERGLARANALDAASYDVAGLGGPALVAVVASLAGAGPALAATAAVAFVGLALVAGAPMPGPTTNPGKPAAPHEGLVLLWRVPELRATTAATTIGFAAQGLLPVTFPLLALHFGHPAGHGAWFLTALSAGSLAGALASARLLSRFDPVPVLAVALAVLGLALAGIAATPTLPLALAVALVGGVATGPMLAATLAVRQRSVPSGRYGQVVATAASIKVGAYALGAAATGPVTAWLPPRGVLLLVGAAQLVALLPLRVAARSAIPRTAGRAAA